MDIPFLLRMDQQTALDILKMGHNVFLTGPAGSGKTFVLNAYIDWLKSRGMSVAVTASTGIAATHLHGTTIHSWSGLGVREISDESDIQKIAHNRMVRQRILKAKVLVIDEISMLHARQLDAVEAICRRVRDRMLPFGGLQVVLCGDFFQLPPVRREGETEPSFAFASYAWQTADMKVCYLDEQHRQSEGAFLRILNALRRDEVDEEVFRFLDECRHRVLDNDVRPARLFTHNADVDAINQRELSKIHGKSLVYTMQSGGKEKVSEVLRKSCLAPERLVLKAGAQVMFVKNNFDAGYVNGTLGTVIGFDEESRMPIVQTFGGKFITANPEMWAIEEEDEVIATIRQVPLRLAWAITVHKSQGMSLDAAEVDLGKSFEYGMGYVALSRVRSLEGLSILSLNAMALQIHPSMRETDEEFIRQSECLEGEVAAMDVSEKEAKQKSFAPEPKVPDEKKEDGSPDSSDAKKEKKATFSLEELRKKFPKAYMPWTEEEDARLRELFAQSTPIPELAKIFQRKRGAIRSRLKKLGLINPAE